MKRRELLLAFLLPGLLCAAWTLVAGKDVNWDLLNYHYYLPFEWMKGRLDQDFFAASAQSYLNPLGYLPFYFMVSSGWHALLASMTLAVAHSLSLALLYLLSWKLFAHLPWRDRVVFSCLATALGAASGVFWATVGSSFLDPLLAPLMLAGVLLLQAERHAVRCAAVAGGLFGAAAALKYSNAIFVVAALPLALAMPGQGRGARLRSGAVYAAGAAIALLLLAGPWLVTLQREFGNPVFPLMNAWFQSPHAPAVNLVSERFIPRDLAAALAFPFRMVSLDRALYSETFAPDLRFAALLVAGAALPLVAARASAPPARALRGADWRALAFLGFGSVLWIASTANARYGMVMLLLAGVCLARLVERLLPAAAARAALAVLLAVQLATSVLAAPSRWFVAEPWSKSWLPYQVPERALREPALYLTVETLPMAVVVPFVHPASAFVNFRGLLSLPPDSARLLAMLERHRGRVRTLGRGLELVQGKPREEQLKAYDKTLRRIGYRVDAADCFTIAWVRDDADLLSRAANRLAGAWPSSEPLSVVSCALLETRPDPSELEEERRMSRIFDRIEKSCPALFRGQTAVTEPLGEGWSRHYAGLDARLEAFSDKVIFNRYRVFQGEVDVGSVSAWDKPVPPRILGCGAT